MKKYPQFIVLKSGWLWDHARYQDRLVREVMEGYTIALNTAMRGEEPGRLDDSAFWRVDAKYVGKILTVKTSFEAIRKFGFAEALLPDGTKVRVENERPLSYKKWGKKAPKGFAYSHFAQDWLQG